jgi:hypothetical protein
MKQLIFLFFGFLLITSCGMVDKIPTVKIIVKNESDYKIDSVWIYADSSISKCPMIIGAYDKNEINRTISTCCFHDTFKFWIKLSNKKEFESSVQYRQGDLNGYKLIVKNGKVDVVSTNYFIILNYIKAFIFVMFLILLLKATVSIIILRPENKLVYCIRLLFFNSLYLAILYSITKLLKQFRHYDLNIFITIIIGLIIAIILDSIYLTKKYKGIRKDTLIVSSAILSNLSLFIIGVFLLMLYIVWIF